VLPCRCDNLAVLLLNCVRLATAWALRCAPGMPCRLAHGGKLAVQKKTEVVITHVEQQQTGRQRVDVFDADITSSSRDEIDKVVEEITSMGHAWEASLVNGTRVRGRIRVENAVGQAFFFVGKNVALRLGGRLPNVNVVYKHQATSEEAFTSLSVWYSAFAERVRHAINIDFQ